MSLYSSYQEPHEKADSIYLINPTVTEFQTQIFDDDNNAIAITLAPLETREFQKALGQTVLTHLANFILNNEGFSYKTSPKKELEAIKRRCIVHE